MSRLTADTIAQHVSEAEALLRFADRARNADNWIGDRAADSAALGACAQAHATLALVGTLQHTITVADANSV